MYGCTRAQTLDGGRQFIKTILDVVFPFFVCNACIYIYICLPGNICTYYIPLVWRSGAFVVVYTTATPAVFRLVRLLLLRRRAFYAYTLTYGNHIAYIGYLYKMPQTSSFCPKHLDFVSCSYICVFILFYFVLNFFFHFVYSCVYIIESLRACIHCLAALFAPFFQGYRTNCVYRFVKNLHFFFGIILRGFCKVVLRLYICLYTELRKWKDGYILIVDTFLLRAGAVKMIMGLLYRG